MLTCPECAREFNTARGLGVHRRVHERTKEARLPADAQAKAITETEKEKGRTKEARLPVDAQAEAIADAQAETIKKEARLPADAQAEAIADAQAEAIKKVANYTSTPTAIMLPLEDRQNIIENFWLSDVVIDNG